MKNLLLLLIVFMILMSSSCNPDTLSTPTTDGEGNMDESTQESTKPEGISFAQSNLSRETSPGAEPENFQSLVESNTKFALSFYDLINDKDGNIVYSPLSLSLALSMTLAGAETSTEQRMLNALQLGLMEEQVHPTFNALLIEIDESMKKQVEESLGDNFILNIANSLWGQSGFDFKEEFLNKLAINYGSGLFNVDFSQNPESSRDAINDWVEHETEEKIKDLIPQGGITPLTRLVLANAIYFNGSWLHPFNKTLTTSAPFTLLDGSEQSVQMMKLSGQSFSYSKGDNYHVIALPYLNNDFNMLIIVPDTGSFTSMEGKLTPEFYANITNQMVAESVDLEMPKFDFETTTSGNAPLSELGMAEAFIAGQADFSGITGSDDLYITDVLHKATITVDEEGTEAAAATAVIVGIKSMPSEPIKLIIDRPFLFFIRHQPTGTILFMGRVTQP